MIVFIPNVTFLNNRNKQWRITCQAIQLINSFAHINLIAIIMLTMEQTGFSIKTEQNSTEHANTWWC